MGIYSITENDYIETLLLFTLEKLKHAVIRYRHFCPKSGIENALS